jgi:hypothetical protein
VALALAIATMGAAAAVYLDGPPPGFTGGFGEQSCAACHFAADVNDPAGKVFIDGAPERWTPGETYRLAIVLTRPSMAIGGFQLAARFAEAGTQAGTLAPAEDEGGRVTVATDRGVQYAYQLRPGTELTRPDTARWTLLWTAPETGGRVIFHVAANAADGDDSIDGDYVYTADRTARSLTD